MGEAEQRHLVVIGGGRGVSQVALATQPYFAKISVIIAVTDTGRSTGVARSLGDIPAPGDLRNTLATLAAEPDGLMARLLQHRFRSAEHPSLDGMALGNLILAALCAETGDMAKAVATVSEWLSPKATVIPASRASAQLCAELANGEQRIGELAVRGFQKAAIQRLYLDWAAPAYPAALEAIMQADLIAIGPGSFYTSVCAALLFDGIAAAIHATRARTAFICNTTTQPGQTDGLGAADHVRALLAIIGPRHLDYALLNRSPELPPEMRQRYEQLGLHLLAPQDAELAEIGALGVTPVVGDYAERSPAIRELWNKLDAIRHDPTRLGAALAALPLDGGDRGVL